MSDQTADDLAMAGAPQPCDLLVHGAVVMTLDRSGRVLNDAAVAVRGRDIVWSHKYRFAGDEPDYGSMPRP